jgi:hypothetical protein
MITKRGPRGPYNVEHKSRNLNIRVTDKMHNAIQRAAKRTRQPISAIVTRCICNGLKVSKGGTDVN